MIFLAENNVFTTQTVLTVLFWDMDSTCCISCSLLKQKKMPILNDKADFMQVQISGAGNRAVFPGPPQNK
jgi:hypothetical protein